MTVEWIEVGGTNHPRFIADLGSSPRLTLFVFADVISPEGGYIWQIEQAADRYDLTRSPVTVVEQGHEMDLGDAKSAAEGAING